MNAKRVVMNANQSILECDYWIQSFDLITERIGRMPANNYRNTRRNQNENGFQILI